MAGPRLRREAILKRFSLPADYVAAVFASGVIREGPLDDRTPDNL
jgi:hypothetical protein